MKKTDLPMSLKQKYGPLALVAGASEGLGAAFAETLAAQGLDIVLVARRKEALEREAERLRSGYGIKVLPLVCDLSQSNAAEEIMFALDGKKIGFLVYNAAYAPIGPFLQPEIPVHMQVAWTNMLTPIKLLHTIGRDMTAEGRGGAVLVSSMAGLQGSGFLSSYAASKAFLKILSEGLWYEWKKKGVDVIACCAGATLTPSYQRSQPGKTGWWVPRPQQPMEVVRECLNRIGHYPSFVSGRGNKIAHFFMRYLLKGRSAINIMGRNTEKMYAVLD
jgi:short-subunit dehydrogenase